MGHLRVSGQDRWPFAPGAIVLRPGQPASLGEYPEPRFESARPDHLSWALRAGAIRPFGCPGDPWKTGIPLPSEGGPEGLDDRLLRETTGLLLGAMGHTVTPAEDGPQALDLLAAGGSWDAVLMDLNMPGLDGLETLRRLRALRADLPVVIVSGFAEADVREKIRAQGRATMLQKPFSLEEVQVVLDALSLGDPLR